MNQLRIILLSALILLAFSMEDGDSKINPTSPKKYPFNNDSELTDTGRFFILDRKLGIKAIAKNPLNM
jgi:hypothetical protein